MDHLTMLLRPLTVAITSVLTLYAASAQAGEPWPQRPVRVITPFAAGTDGAVRPFAEQLSKRWKQPVVIENRPGADGLIGASTFTSTRDDHTLFYYSAAATTTLPLTHRKLPMIRPAISFPSPPPSMPRSRFPCPPR